jgi:hypothetical protein
MPPYNPLTPLPSIVRDSAYDLERRVMCVRWVRGRA